MLLLLFLFCRAKKSVLTEVRRRAGAVIVETIFFASLFFWYLLLTVTPLFLTFGMHRIFSYKTFTVLLVYAVRIRSIFLSYKRVFHLLRCESSFLSPGKVKQLEMYKSSQNVQTDLMQKWTDVNWTSWLHSISFLFSFSLFLSCG